MSAASKLVLLYYTADSDQIVSSTYFACTQHCGTVHIRTCFCIHYVGLECVEPIAGLNTPTVYVFVFLRSLFMYMLQACMQCLLLYLLEQTPDGVQHQLFSSWVDHLNVEHFDFKCFLASKSEQLQWKMEGLLADQLSMENVCVLLQVSSTSVYMLRCLCICVYVYMHTHIL